MRQQINLYQPIFREQRKLFSARTVGSALLAIVATLVAIYLYGSWQVNALSNEVAKLRAEQQANEARMTSLGTLQGSRADTTSIDAKITALNAELSVRSRALQALQSGAAGQSTGFASRFEALARSHIDGLWLDHVVLAGGAGAMSLSGGVTDPALVPRYLQALANESALAGARFDEFVLESPKPASAAATEIASAVKEIPGSLHFRASSSAIPHDRAEGAT